MELRSGQNTHNDDDRKDIANFEDLNCNFEGIPNISPEMGMHSSYINHSNKWRKDSEIIMSGDNPFQQKGVL